MITVLMFWRNSASKVSLKWAYASWSSWFIPELASIRLNFCCWRALQQLREKWTADRLRIRCELKKSSSVVVVVVYLNESFVVWSVNLRDISSSHDEGELIQSVVNDHNFRLNFEVVRSPSLESTWQDRSCLFYKYSIDIKDLSNRKLMKICDSGHKCTNDDKQEASVVFTLKEIDDWFTR